MAHCHQQEYRTDDRTDTQKAVMLLIGTDEHPLSAGRIRHTAIKHAVLQLLTLDTADAMTHLPAVSAASDSTRAVVVSRSNML